MSTDFAIVPASQGDDGFVQLSRSKTGRVFRKQILKFGDLFYDGVKGGKVKIDQEFADKLILNFTNKVCDIVQVPKAGPNNEHTEDPDRNIGEVVDIVVLNNKIYADIDVRDEDAAKKLGKTLLGASAMMHLNYEDKRIKEKVGPTLLHVAVTNRPYVVDLEDFEELVAASADGMGDEPVFLTATTHKERTMTELDELLAALKDDHNIDVTKLQKQASEGVKLSAALQENLTGSGVIKLSNGETASTDDLVAGVVEAGTKIVELSNTVSSIQTERAQERAETRVSGLIREGRILPAEKDSRVKLLLSNSELFDELLPEKAIIKLSVEEGHEVSDELAADTAASEIARLTSSDAAQNYIRS